MNELEMKLTGRYVPNNPRMEAASLVKIDIDEKLAQPFSGMMNEYRITATFGTVVECYSADKHNMFVSVRERLRHAIYGELIDGLYQLQEAYYGNDPEKFRMYLRDLLSMATGKPQP